MSKMMHGIHVILKCLYDDCPHTSETTSICTICGLCSACSDHTVCQTGMLPWSVRWRILSYLIDFAPADPNDPDRSELHRCCQTLVEADDPWSIVSTYADGDNCYAIAEALIAEANNRRIMHYIAVEKRIDGLYSVAILAHGHRQVRHLRVAYHSLYAALRAIDRRFKRRTWANSAILDALAAWRKPQSEIERQYWRRFAYLKLTEVGFVVRTQQHPQHAGIEMQILIRERPDLEHVSHFLCPRCHKHAGYSWRFPLCFWCAQELSLATTFVGDYLPNIIARELPVGYLQLACGCQMRNTINVGGHLDTVAVYVHCPVHPGSQQVLQLREG